MVVDNFPWNKKNMKPSKTEPMFYKLFISRIANAADKKFEEYFDSISKQMKLHFDGIPTNVLGIIKEHGTFDSSNTIPIYRELICKILSLGIVDSALLNKSYLKKDQETSLKILFHVITNIFSRINAILENSDSATSDEELVANIRQIAEEEWSSKSYGKIERSLNELHDCCALIKFRKMQQEKQARQKLMKAKSSVSGMLTAPQKSNSSCSESPSNHNEKEENGFCLDSSSGEPEKEKSLDDELCVKQNDEASCLTPSLRITPMLCVRQEGEQLCTTPPPQLTSVNVLEDDAELSNHSLMEMPTLVSILSSGQDSSAVETPVIINNNDNQSLPGPPQDVSLQRRKEPSPEIEIINEVHRCPNTSTLVHQMKRARLRRSSENATTPVFHLDNSFNTATSCYTRHQLVTSAIVSTSPQPLISVASTILPRTVSSISASISSTTEQGVHHFQRNMMPTGIPSRFPAALAVHNANRPVLGRSPSRGTPKSGFHQPTPSTSANRPNSIVQAHRLTEIGTLMAVLNKFANELTSQVMESYEPRPGAISYKCSMGSSATSLFVGFSTRQDNDLFECRFWALVHLYQSLQLIFPSFVLDDIRTSAINGSWAKIDRIIHNCKPLFKYVVGKINGIAPQSRFSTESELQILLQQRLLITHAIENASRLFWALPSTSVTSVSRMC